MGPGWDNVQSWPRDVFFGGISLDDVMTIK